MSKPLTSDELQAMMLSSAERALIETIRRLPNGSYIEGVGVVGRVVDGEHVGQPGVIKGCVARCDLQHEPSQEAILSRGLSGMLPPNEKSG
ncbi:hypothetical protein EON81_16150 [bacterium]|nr:MAG: hypothetical protein EON81_16150 [bacterium]